MQQVHGINNEPCSICEESRYTYKCTNCEQFAHPLCAYLQGWRMKFDRQTGVSLNCCEVGVDRDKNEKKRKFILNYKKCVFRVEG